MNCWRVQLLTIVAAVVTGVELARVDLDNGEAQGVLTGFGGWEEHRGARPPLSGNFVARPRFPSVSPSSASCKSCSAFLRSLTDMASSTTDLTSVIADSWPLIS